MDQTLNVFIWNQSVAHNFDPVLKKFRGVTLEEAGYCDLSMEEMVSVRVCLNEPALGIMETLIASFGPTVTVNFLGLVGRCHQVSDLNVNRQSSSVAQLKFIGIAFIKLEEE